MCLCFVLEKGVGGLGQSGVGQRYKRDREKEAVLALRRI